MPGSRILRTRPIHVFGTFGIGLVAAGTVVLAWLGGQRLLFGTPLASRPLVFLAILFVVTGMQFVTLGLLGEMLARTYHESQGKPIYAVAEDLVARQDAGPSDLSSVLRGEGGPQSVSRAVAGVGSH